MGMLDQVLNQALPGGSSVAKPLMIALGSLAVGRLVGSSAAGSTQAAATPSTGQGTAASNGGAAAPASATPQTSPNAAAGAGTLGGLLATGLGGVLQALQNSGHDNAVKSWVGSGQNQPIQPSQLSSALGKNTVSALAQHTGMNEQQLVSQLASALPGVVDKLTANGTLPNMKELESDFLQNLQK